MPIIGAGCNIVQNLFITPEDTAGTIWATGFLQQLGAGAPSARTTILCPPQLAFLFAHYPQARRVLPHKSASARHELLRFGGVRWQHLVDLRARPMTRWLWARQRHIYAAMPPAAHPIARMAAAFGMAEPASPCLWLAPAARGKARRLLPDERLHICFAPSAGHAVPDWPLKNYAELAWRLASGGGALTEAHILFIAPPSDKGADDFVNNVPSGQFSDFSHLSLAELAAIFCRADMFVGGGGLLAHLAAAANIPTLCLFAADVPPDVREIAYGPKTRYLYGDAGVGDTEKIAELIRDLWQAHK